MRRGFSALLSGILIGSVLNTMGSIIATEATGQRVGPFATQSSDLVISPSATDGGAFVINGVMRMKIAADGMITIYNAEGSERVRIAIDNTVSILEGLDSNQPHVSSSDSSSSRISQAESTFDVRAGSGDTTIARFGRDEDGEFQSLVELRTAKTLISSGSEIGRGAIRLIDNIASPARTMELGFYEFGSGLFADSYFEFWTQGVSVRSLGDFEPVLAVRDKADKNGIALRHDGTQGIIETGGVSPGGIQMGGNGPNVFVTKFGPVMELTDDGNVGVGVNIAFGNGSGVIGIADATVVPTSNPTEGGILYVENGTLKYRGPSGTVTTLAKP
jgi:hypothetical protein